MRMHGVASMHALAPKSSDRALRFSWLEGVVWRTESGTWVWSCAALQGRAPHSLFASRRGAW